MDKNQFSLRHSCLNRELKVSIVALSVGFPGPVKSSVTLFQQAPWSSTFDVNSQLLSTRVLCGVPRIPIQRTQPTQMSTLPMLIGCKLVTTALNEAVRILNVPHCA